ncbi:MAG: deoxyribose-phosphate aldolase [Ignavibacteriales bacterium]|nr:deoxyribose-phosphate aldolase [Ignavibacteriales bacterium]MBK8663526.1 deoxyribose-phosphate aldolase [Ignavibacteriales bacterium]
METNRISKIVHQALLERKLNDFYCTSETCKGWERNVVTQPLTVNKIVSAGAERISAGIGVGHELTDHELARMIDHTLLKPDATIDEIKTLCSEAKQFEFASVCINPCHVKLCSDLLRGTRVKVCTVIGFPLGSNPTAVKRAEAEQAISEGAQELDMVLNVGWLKSKMYREVFDDIQQIVIPAKNRRVIVKVILETCLLTDEEIVKASLICKQAGASYVKTSTGFSKSGATVQAVALMKKVVGSTLGVKASGGIRTTEDARAMVESGADRIGASASVKIVTGGGSGSGTGSY